YSLTGNPFYLGLIGLMEIVPAISVALFAGHVVDQTEKRGLLMKCIIAFSIVSTGLFLLTVPEIMDALSHQNALIGIYALVFVGGVIRAFIGPTVFSLLAQVVPKKAYPNAATWSSSVWQMASVLGPASAGLAIHLIGVH